MTFTVAHEGSLNGLIGMEKSCEANVMAFTISSSQRVPDSALSVYMKEFVVEE